MEINNITINNIFECFELQTSLKSQIDASSILADHLARAFDLLDSSSTKTSTLREDV